MSRQSVLVVEDEEDIMEVIRFNLEKEGYEVNQALSGEKALQLIEKRECSVIDRYKFTLILSEYLRSS